MCTKTVQQLYHTVSRLYHICTNAVSRLYHDCSTAVPRQYHGSTMAVPRLCHGCTNAVLCLYHGCTSAVPMVYHGCTMAGQDRGPDVPVARFGPNTVGDGPVGKSFCKCTDLIKCVCNEQYDCCSTRNRSTTFSVQLSLN